MSDCMTDRDRIFYVLEIALDHIINENNLPYLKPEEEEVETCGGVVEMEDT